MFAAILAALPVVAEVASAASAVVGLAGQAKEAQASKQQQIAEAMKPSASDMAAMGLTEAEDVDQARSA